MPVEAALIAVRALHFVSVLWLLGTHVFQATMLPPSMAAALVPRFLAWDKAASAAALLTAMAWLMLAAADASGSWPGAIDPLTLRDLLFETTFGQVWVLRLALAAGMLVLSLWHFSKAQSLKPCGAVLLAGSLGFIGHGAMFQGGAGLLQSGALAAHVLAAGGWFGALPALILCLGRGGPEFTVSTKAAALRGFSQIGQWAVAFVVVSGMLLTRSVIGEWPSTIETSYRAVLAVKVTLVALMIGLALFNKYRMMPRLTRDGAGAANIMLRSATAEAILGLAVLVVVAALGDMSPSEI